MFCMPLIILGMKLILGCNGKEARHPQPVAPQSSSFVAIPELFSAVEYLSLVDPRPLPTPIEICTVSLVATAVELVCTPSCLFQTGFAVVPHYKTALCNNLESKVTW